MTKVIIEWKYNYILLLSFTIGRIIIVLFRAEWVWFVMFSNPNNLFDIRCRIQVFACVWLFRSFLAHDRVSGKELLQFLFNPQNMPPKRRSTYFAYTIREKRPVWTHTNQNVDFPQSIKEIIGAMNKHGKPTPFLPSQGMIRQFDGLALHGLLTNHSYPYNFFRSTLPDHISR